MSAFQIVEAQQQVDQGRLAGAGAPDDAHLLPRAHAERQLVDHPAGLAVVEANALETDRAFVDGQGPGCGAVLHAVGLGNGLDAVLHRAHVLEEAGDGAQDPARHLGQADDQADGDGDGPGGDAVAHP